MKLQRSANADVLVAVYDRFDFTPHEEAGGLRMEEEESHEGVETPGGLIAAPLGRISEVGEHIGIGCRALRVEARDGRRIATVRLLALAAGTEQKKSTPEPRRSG